MIRPVVIALIKAATLSLTGTNAAKENPPSHRRS
jgi:hypothetical protein